MIAIIPARGGSKRIPRKNLIDFCGKPLIAHTIEAAIAADLFSEVFVNTDDEEIAEIAVRYGASVPFLRTKYHDDTSPVSLATFHFLETLLHHRSSHEFRTVVQLMPNCPLRTSDDIIAAVRSFKQWRRSFQISCFEFGWMNPWWAYRLDTRGKPDPLFSHEIRNQRSQDLPKLYGPTGAIWLANRTEFVTERTFYGQGYCLEPLSWKNAVDIDSYEDLEFARAVAILNAEHHDKKTSESLRIDT